MTDCCMLRGFAATSWASDRIDILATNGPNSQMMHTSWDASYGWQGPWDSLGGDWFGPPTLVSWSADRLDAFGQDANTDQMLHNSWNSMTWEDGWTALDTLTFKVGGFAVTSWGPDRLDVFGVGDLDGAMYHQSWNGNQWQSDWENHGGVFTSVLAATSWADNRIDIVGYGTDKAMYHLAYDGNNYGWQTQWDSLGGIFKGDPTVISWSSNRLDVFGIGLDNAMYHKAWDGSSWSADWENLGGTFTTSPTAVSWGPGRIDLFGLSDGEGQGQLWHSSYDGNSYGWQRGWDKLGSNGLVFTTQPVAVSRGSNSLDVFVQASTGAYWHLAWDGSAWSTPEPIGYANPALYASSSVAAPAPPSSSYTSGIQQGTSSSPAGRPTPSADQSLRPPSASSAAQGGPSTSTSPNGASKTVVSHLFGMLSLLLLGQLLAVALA